MSLAIIQSRAQVGIHAPLVTVEADLSNGLPSFSIVGLPETAVKESRDRVRSAILNSQLEFPCRRITVNLAPADLPKEGGRFDLPIALGILAASGQIPLDHLPQYEFAGELALSGELRPVRGILPFAINAHKANKTLVIAKANAAEAGLVKGLTILAADHIATVCAHLNAHQLLTPYTLGEFISTSIDYPDLAEVHGQIHAKRALEIAAAGGHSLLLHGPPGTGKTMLASRLPGLLPDLSESEAIEVAILHSIAGKPFIGSTWRKRSFRSPHHTASSVALVGGGRPPFPGEISLAHHGVLFLDELPEFERRVLEALREPLESGTVCISRAARQAEFPARFQLIAAMNPCPCGHYNNPQQTCACTPEQIHRYQAKISGPLLDRIDIHLAVLPLAHEELFQTNQQITAEPSATVRARVTLARQQQIARQDCANFALTGKALKQHCYLNPASLQLMQAAMEKLKLSARGYHRMLRVARTIADLANENNIEPQHISEALSYRRQ